VVAGIVRMGLKKIKIKMTFNIQVTDKTRQDAIQRKIDFKTKPLGALGQLEDVALQLCLIQHTLTPSLKSPHLVVFAADHGIAEAGVSQYPAEVTRQMVLNFANGGAAINVFCRQNGLTLKVVDAGVKGGSFDNPLVENYRIDNGTANFLLQPAMTSEQLEQCFKNGKNIVEHIKKTTDCNVIGFGEMGIGNTSSAAVLMHKFTKLPLSKCVGRGTGLDNDRVKQKIAILKQAVDNQRVENAPLPILTTFGGFEIATMTAAMLTAAENGMTILVDGFIATSAFLAAHALDKTVKDYALFCHLSDEAGHQRMLNFLEVKPLLRMGMRLGEGTGAALAYPIVQAAALFMNEMASFETAGVTNV
jgi:nicotinate-nucleotide--dimethylbenzimidazole phosphoribosyltransferase